MLERDELEICTVPNAEVCGGQRVRFADEGGESLLVSSANTAEIGYPFSVILMSDPLRINNKIECFNFHIKNLLIDTNVAAYLLSNPLNRLLASYPL